MGLLDRPGQSQRYGLLSPDVMGLIQSGGPRVAPAAPAAPRRDRVSGWRVFDRVLGGQTVTEGLDAERARLEAEALRPQARQRMEANRAAAAAMGPAALIAFDANPESFGESLGMQYRPVTTASGSITSYGPGEGARRVAAPVVERFDDRFGSFDPLNPQAGARYTAARGPTQSELTAEKVADTGRINALNVPVAPNTDLVDPTTGRQIYQGFRAPEVNSVTAGGSLAITDPVTGALINTVQGNAPVRAVPDAVRRDNERDQAAIDTRELTTARIDNAIALIDNNSINLSPADRASAWLRNNTGNSSPQSRAQAELRRTVETLRNNILNDATGPQTDGDSLRALNQILDGWGDERVVRDGLSAYAEIQRGKTASQRRIMAGRLAEYGEDGSSAPAGGGQPAGAAPAQGQPVRIYNDDDYARLPSGATFQGPDGVTRRKP